MEKVTGRTADFLLRRDGSMVAGVTLLDKTLTAVPGISSLQIVQEDMDRFTFYLVPDNRYSSSTDQGLRQEMESIFGREIKVSIEMRSGLPQERNGKYRFSICKIRNVYAGGETHSHAGQGVGK